MKLIIKRIGAEPRKASDGRALALFTEDGTPLPCQASLVIESEPHRPPKVIVTFYLDDEHISLA